MADGSITDSSGTISFGNEILTTTGTITGGVISGASGSTFGNLTLADGSITDSSGTISFGNENLICNNITLDPNSASGAAFTISNTTTQTSGDLVSITGDSGENALNVPTGDVLINDRLGIGAVSSSYELNVQASDTGLIARIYNTNTSSSADGLSIRLGPTSNPASTNNFIVFEDGDGTDLEYIEGDGAGGARFTGDAMGTYSDIRLKDNMVNITNGLRTVNKMDVVEYDLKSDTVREFKRYGFKAQQLLNICPQAVWNPDKNGKNIDKQTGEQILESDKRYKYMKVNMGSVTPLLTAAIQELSSKVDTLNHKFGLVEPK